MIGNNHIISILSVNSDNSSQLKLLHHEENHTIIDFDIYSNEILVWVEKYNTNIRSSSKQFSNVKYLDEWTPHAIAFDFITEKLYIVDKEAETVNVVDMKSKYCDIVLADLQNPDDIILDPILGIMFILQEYDSVITSFILSFESFQFFFLIIKLLCF